MNPLSLTDYANHCFKRGMRSGLEIERRHIRLLNLIIDKRVKSALRAKRKAEAATPAK
ncbi:MAG: hypothetical protein NE327_10690 [Lentisphaeraceae bacterium]|nr:hypothetical protein [Lentisphaeraceae bacterium]